MRGETCVVVGLAWCFAAGVAYAQGGKPSGVIGVAIDSLDGKALVGAVVSVVGTGREATTDAKGGFRIDSVVPGKYVLALDHPLLDSIGLAVGSDSIQLPPGRYVIAKIAVPSQAGLVATLCPASKRLLGPAVLVGRVFDAENEGVPVTGARVQVTWQQTEVSKAVGVRRLTTTREAVVDAGGAYRVCGIPANVAGTARAVLGTDATADVPVALLGDLVKIMTFRLSRANTVAAADTTVRDSVSTPAAVDSAGRSSSAAATRAAQVLKRGTAVVSGRVFDKGGRPVAGATVNVQGAAGQAVTDSGGAFRLTGQPAGTQALLVRKVGYAAATQVVELSARTVVATTVTVDVAPPTLAPVTVTSKRDQGLKQVGFTDRQKMGMGHFLTEADIAKKDPLIISDVFTTMPGITVDWSSGHPVLKGSRTAGGGCVNYYIDDVPYTPQTAGDIDSYMKPDELAAVEVYNAVDAPAEYQQAGKTNCTVIVMWTKTKVGG